MNSAVKHRSKLKNGGEECIAENYFWLSFTKYFVLDDLYICWPKHFRPPLVHYIVLPVQTTGFNFQHIVILRFFVYFLFISPKLNALWQLPPRKKISILCLIGCNTVKWTIPSCMSTTIICCIDCWFGTYNGALLDPVIPNESFTILEALVKYTHSAVAWSGPRWVA